jgi:hypothetical protein
MRIIDHPQVAEYTGAFPTFDAQFHWADLVNEKLTHIHAITTLPIQGVISEPVEIDFGIVAFQIHGRVVLIDVACQGVTLFSVTPKLLTDPDGITRVDNKVWIDPAKIPYSGKLHLNFRVRTTFINASEALADNLNIPVFIDNGKPDLSAVDGWYVTHNGRAQAGPPNTPSYMNVFYTSPIPVAPINSPFTVSAKFQRAKGSFSPWETLAAYDPDLHADPPNPGSVIFNDVENTGFASKSVTIDPSTLTPGPHKLMLMATTDNGGLTPFQANPGVTFLNIVNPKPPEKLYNVFIDSGDVIPGLNRDRVVATVDSYIDTAQTINIAKVD